MQSYWSAALVAWNLTLLSWLGDWLDCHFRIWWRRANEDKTLLDIVHDHWLQPLTHWRYCDIRAVSHSCNVFRDSASIRMVKKSRRNSERRNSEKSFQGGPQYKVLAVQGTRYKCPNQSHIHTGDLWPWGCVTLESCEDRDLWPLWCVKIVTFLP